MSRIGNRKLTIPTGVEVTLNDGILTTKSSKGSLDLVIDPLIEVNINDGIITTVAKNNSARANVVVGTTNSLINNNLIGVSEGYKKDLEIIGVGYRFNVAGNKITINAGYSNPVIVEVPAGLTATLINNNEISISGIDKQKVNQFAAEVREVRSPEPYKGKGIRYKNEHIRRKEGKKAAK